MINNKSIYFPAISWNSHLKMMTNYEHIKTGKNFDFWNTGYKIFYHPYLLVSAGILFKTEPDLSKIMNFDTSKGILLGDSGGFQLANNIIKYTEENIHLILKWLEKNTNYALNIDFPTYLSSKYKCNQELFKKNLNISCKNFRYFKENGTGTTKFLNVLHGRDLKSLNTWYDAVKDFDFDGGWAVGGTSVNLYFVLQSFFYLYEKGEIEKLNGKNSLIHFLGYSKYKTQPYIFYLQDKLNRMNLDIRISYDSSTFWKTAGFGHYYLYNKRTGPSLMKLSNNIVYKNSKINKEIELPCSCPICNGITYQDLINLNGDREIFSEYIYMYMAIHNLYLNFDYKKVMENVILSDNEEIIDSVFNTQDKVIFNIIDKAFEAKSPFNYIQQSKKLITNSELKDKNSKQKNKLSNILT